MLQIQVLIIYFFEIEKFWFMNTDYFNELSDNQIWRFMTT